MRAYLLLLALSALVSFVLTPAVRVLALKGRVYTPRRQRDVHRRPVPKLGGVAMLAGVLAGLGIGAMVPFLDGIFTDPDPVRGVLMALAVVLVMGVADDLWDLHWTLKLAGQVGAAALVALHGIRVEAMPVGWIPVGSEPIQVGLTIFILVLTMNAINFVDGLDGLAAGIAVIGGSAFFIYSYLLTRTINQFDYSNLATLLMALLVGTCLGFLPHNFNPARIFMGDSGSMLIGVLLAAATTSASGKIPVVVDSPRYYLASLAPLIVLAAVLFVPVLDLAMAVVRRTRAGMSPFSPDKMHLHHRLLEIGHSQRRAVLLIYLWAGVLAFGAVALTFITDAVVVLWTVGFGLLLAALASAIPRMRHRV
jgi:UDP-GlcNAc:undecaprenyl-phosphate GlcNAc-1-phosphate transferase